MPDDKQPEFDDLLDPVVARDPRYAREAYHFVREALDHTHQMLLARGTQFPRADLGHHISGQELLEGVRELALNQFGPMAHCVLGEWGIRQCADVGEIVFNLVENEILSKTEQDSRADFQSGFDFAEAFRKPFLPATRPLDGPAA